MIESLDGRQSLPCRKVAFRVVNSREEAAVEQFTTFPLSWAAQTVLRKDGTEIPSFLPFDEALFPLRADSQQVKLVLVE